MEPPGAKRPGGKVVEGRVLEVAVQVEEAVWVAW